MPLRLIVGPPNSGRAGLVRRGFEDALGHDPVLVVPTVDDADRFERELCAGGRTVLGGSVGTFSSLFDAVASATGAGAEVAPALQAAQRLAAVRDAVRRTRLRILARSSQRPGFGPALERLIGELQAAALDSPTVTQNAEGDPYLEEIAALFAAYEAVRDELSRSDGHVLAAAATAALRAAPDSWGRRPVLLYGFDDLTAEQLHLVAALAAASEVTVAITFEDRAAMAARARLLAELRDLGPASEVATEPDPAYTSSRTLHHLERQLLADSAPRIAPDDGLRLLKASGARSEAELIGAEIAALLADGIPPDAIAVVLRDPDAQGPLYDQVLSSYAIPVACDAGIPVARTAVGTALLALLRLAAGDGSPGDVVAYLRAPGRAAPASVDWLERSVRRDRIRDADGALVAWKGDLWELDALREAGDGAGFLETLARIARNLAERPHERSAARVSGADRLEVRAAAAVAASLAQVAELAGIEAGRGPAEAAAAIEGLRVRIWQGPAEGRVRVVSPYRVRARRFEHVFVGSLQQGDFPRRGSDDPFLSDDRRAQLGLPERSAPEDEERYLFHACVSRPTRRLHLSFSDVDEDGRARDPSIFVEEVLDLLDGSANGSAPPVRRRGLGDVVFAPQDAPSEGELARSLAALGPAAAEALAALELDGAQAAELGATVEEARARAAFLPGPLTLEPVLERLRDRDGFGASTLEGYAVCPYRWFVDHELAPQNLEPKSESLIQGGVVHRALQRLYADPPADGPLPRPDTLTSWLRRAGELLDAALAESELGGAGAAAKAARERLLALVRGHLEREALRETALRPLPELLEAGFGGRDDAISELDLGEFRLHGSIDRVDVSADGRRGLITDYKISPRATIGANLLKEGKLQLQLYTRALSLWGIEPLGAVYHPLGAGEGFEARGLARAEERDGLLAGEPIAARDHVDDREFDERVSGAVSRATGIVAAMRAGTIARDPIDGTCPSWCAYQPICRRERAAPEDELDAEAEEEAR